MFIVLILDSTTHVNSVRQICQCLL